MSKIALIGPPQMVNPLSSLGLEVHGCDSGRRAEEALLKLKEKGDFSIIFITERLAMDCPETIESLQEKINLILLPDNRGSVGLFKEKLEKLIREATGALKV